MKRFSRFIFNFFWVLFIGLWSAISNAVLGVACCITVVGIPFGLQYFKFIRLVFAPAGKVVVTKFSRHPIMNTIWLILGGLEMMIVYYALGLVLFITVIGAPMGIQLFKIAAFEFAPFGAEVLCDGEYSKEQNLSYDYRMLIKRIAQNPQKEVGLNIDGTPETAAQRLKDRQASFVKMRQRNTILDKREKILEGVALAIFIPLGLYFDLGSMLLSVFLMIAPTVLLIVIFGFINAKRQRAFYERTIADLIPYYPNGSPEMKKVATFEQFATAIGVLLPQDRANTRMRF